MMYNETLPKVVISVLNWNQLEMTKICLKKLGERTQYENYEIVVVDNGSEDGSVAAIREEFPDVEIIENEKNRGFGPAHNQVMEGREAEYYTLFNNDAEPQTGWLTPLVEFAEDNPDVGVQGPELRFPGGKIHSGGFFGPLGGYRRLIEKGDLTVVDDVDWVSGAVFFVSDTVVQDVGTFDEIFEPIYFEEVDYCWRIGEQGYRVVYNPNGIVSHDGEPHDEESERVIYLMRKHALIFKLINYPIHWMPFLLVDEVRTFLQAFFSSDKDRRIRQYCHAYVDLLRELSEVYENRTERP